MMDFLSMKPDAGLARNATALTVSLFSAAHGIRQRMGAVRDALGAEKFDAALAGRGRRGVEPDHPFTQAGFTEVRLGAESPVGNLSEVRH
jgi:hypothetical protein